MKFVAQNLSIRVKEEQMHMEKGTTSERKDMVCYLFHAKDPATGGPGYSPAELYEDADMLTVAGSDTTSGVLAAMFFYLTHNPSVLDCLKVEIRESFTSIEEVKAGSILSGCDYLRAVIDETLRMSPPAASDLLREVLPGGLQVFGIPQLIPPGVNVGSPIWALHHDPETFPDPFHFRPERWIADPSKSRREFGSAESVEIAVASFFPFAIGIRGCPGKNLARLELSVTFARLLFSYDIEGEQGDCLGQGSASMMWGRRNQSQFQTKDALIPLRDGPMVRFRRRQN
jgi:cytochrome P450